MELVLRSFAMPMAFRRITLSGFSAVFLHIKDHFIPHHRNNYHPHILGHRSLALFSALLVSVKIFSIGLLAYGPIQPAYSSAITQENIISLTNSSRKVYSLNELTFNQKLTEAAQAKADDMLEKGYFSHNTPDGKTPWDFMALAEYNYLSAGENLAINFLEAEDVENAWMNSPGHKANILNESFQEIGIGISQGEYQGKNAIFVVQMFGRPAQQKMLLNNTPTLVAPQASTLPQEPKAEPVAKLQPEPKAEKPTVEDLPKPGVPLKIDRTEFVQEGNVLKFIAKISGEPVKVLAKFGQAAVMFKPKTEGWWAGEVNLAQLAYKNSGLVLEAVDIKGSKVSQAIGSFSGSTPHTFLAQSPTGNEAPTVNFLGKIIQPTNLEQQFYLGFVVVLLCCLILAIAIKRHVQHLPLVANTSFVIILAVGLWMR